MPRIAEVALFTDDVRSLAPFYERLLGRSLNSSSDSHASFDLEGTTLFIHVLGEGDREGAPNSDHVAFALDQDAAAERARSAGGDVVGPKDYYWGRSAYLRDPDGRAVRFFAPDGQERRRALNSASHASERRLNHTGVKSP